MCVQLDYITSYDNSYATMRTRLCNYVAMYVPTRTTMCATTTTEDATPKNWVWKKLHHAVLKLHKAVLKLHKYSAKVGIKKISSKHTHAGSSFKDLVAKNSTVKTDLNSDARFERYGFLKIRKTKIIVREAVSFKSLTSVNKLNTNNEMH